MITRTTAPASNTDDYRSGVKRRLMAGMAWVLAGRTVGVMVSLLISALLARMLSPADLGIYFLVFSLVSTAAVVAQLGLNRAVVPLVARALADGNASRAKGVAMGAIHLGALGALGIALILPAGVGRWLVTDVLQTPSLAPLLGYAAAWAMLLALTGLLAEIFRGYHRIAGATLFGGLLANVLTAVPLVGLWWMEPGIRDITLILQLSLVAAGASAIFSAYSLWRGPWSGARVETVPVREITSTAWPLFITTVFLFVLSQAGLWILGKYCAPDEVAIYGAAARLVLLVVMPLVVVNAVVPPIITEMYVRKHHRQLEGLLRTVSAIAGIPALLAVAVLAVAGEPIMHAIYGSQYGIGAMVLAVLALGSIVHIWAGTANIVLMSTGHQTTMMVTTAVTGVIAVLLALYAVADYGALGVAVAMAVGGNLQGLGLWWVTHRKTGIWTHMGRLRMHHLHSALRVIRNRGWAHEYP